MPDERAERVAELFKTAIEGDEAERAALLQQESTTVRAEVESLLEHHRAGEKFLESPAMLPVATGTLPDGERVQQYRIESLIGTGGMGEVYLATDTELKRKVALKLVQRGLGTQEMLRRFRQEEEILAGLNHPNIAQLYGTGLTSEGVPFFAMEYVEGTRLDEFCEAQRLTIEERLKIFRKICSAVAYAHQQLVIHRDLKPANIRVTTQGEPKLLDFGIAKLLETAPEQTITLQQLMTPEYASPEQIRGERMTTASDIYSLGVILYELLTGTKPYRLTSRSSIEAARAVIEQAPPRPSENRKSLRGDLDNIVLMAMRKEPARRYSSVAQFSEDVRRYLEGLPIRARKDTFGYRSSKFIARNRIAVAAAAFVAMAVVVALIVSLAQTRNARRQRDLAQRERLKAERINQFLQRMLSFSNQSIMSVVPVAQKKDVTVNQMLDQITPQVESELADQPDVRAQILRTLGSAYASQGQYGSAEKYLREALAVQSQLYGEESTEAASTMIELGVLLFRQFNLEEAARLLEKPVSFYRRQRQAKSAAFNAAKLALALDYLGVVRFYQGDTKAARPLLEEALQTSSNANLQGAERSVRAFNKGENGALFINLGDLDKGEKLVREALEEYRQITTQPHWEEGVTIGYLAVVMLRRNRLDEAEKLLDDAEQIFRQTLGDRNFYLAGCLNQRAILMVQKNDLKGAEVTALDALAMMRESVPNNKLPWVGPMQALGGILIKTGRVDEGRNYYRQALAIYEEQPTRNFNATVLLRVRLSQALLAQNLRSEAEQVAIEAVRQAEENLDFDNPLIKAASQNLATIRERNNP
jgi:eukaryotic-like serine/threonine-protein kinase